MLLFFFFVNAQCTRKLSNILFSSLSKEVLSFLRKTPTFLQYSYFHIAISLQRKIRKSLRTVSTADGLKGSCTTITTELQATVSCAHALSFRRIICGPSSFEYLSVANDSLSSEQQSAPSSPKWCRKQSQRFRTRLALGSYGGITTLA